MKKYIQQGEFHPYLVHSLPLHVAVSNNLGENYVAELQPRYSIFRAVHLGE